MNSNRPTPLAYSKSYHELLSILKTGREEWAGLPRNIVTKPLSREDELTILDPYKLIDELHEDEVGHALSSAAIYGNLKILDAIWSQRGPFEVNYEIYQAEGASYGQHVVDGYLFKIAVDGSTDIFHNAKNAREIKELFEKMPGCGLGWMIGHESPYSAILDSTTLGGSIDLSRNLSFEGDLPIITEAQVEQPELLVALCEQMKKSHYPSAYNHILCWATPEALKRHSGRLRAYTPDVSIHVFGLDGLSESMSPSAFIQALESGKALKPGAISITTQSDNELDPIPSMALGHMGSEIIKHGYTPDNLVLCATTCDFLTDLQIMPIDSGKLEVAREYAEAYFPLDFIATQNDKNSEINATSFRFDIGFREGRSTNSVDSLFKPASIDGFFLKLSKNEALSEYIKSALPFSFIDHWVKRKGANALTLATMQRLYGKDNTGYNAILRIADIDYLHSKGYQFSPDSYVVEYQQKPSGTVDDRETVIQFNFDPMMPWARDTVSKCLDMGLWPAIGMAKPSLAEALKQAAKRPNLMLQETARDISIVQLLQRSGAESCLDSAATPAQRKVVLRVFTSSELKPLMHKLKSNEKRDILSHDIGI